MRGDFGKDFKMFASLSNFVTENNKNVDKNILFISAHLKTQFSDVFVNISCRIPHLIVENIEI